MAARGRSTRWPRVAAGRRPPPPRAIPSCVRWRRASCATASAASSSWPMPRGCRAAPPRRGGGPRPPRSAPGSALRRGAERAPGGAALAGLARVALDGLPPVLAEVELVVASDVTNPLLGELGAAATYGPQKGASSAQVAELDAALAHYADLLEAATARRVRDVPGVGAAGGPTLGPPAVPARLPPPE